MQPDADVDEGVEANYQKIEGSFSTCGKTIAVRPTIHFERATDYHVSIRGVKTSSGVLFARSSGQFRTKNNLVIMEKNHNRTTGAFENSIASEYDASGALVKTPRTSAAGSIGRVTT